MIQEKDEEAKRILGQFSEWAVANTFLYRLMSGEVDVLNEYANYIASQEDEIFIAVWHMVQATNLYGLNIDSILNVLAKIYTLSVGQNRVWRV